MIKKLLFLSPIIIHSFILGYCFIFIEGWLYLGEFFRCFGAFFSLWVSLILIKNYESKLGAIFKAIFILFICSVSFVIVSSCGYFYSIGKPFSFFDAIAILQTNVKEATSFVKVFASQYLFIAVIFTLLTGFYCIWLIKNQFKLKVKWAFILILILSIASVLVMKKCVIARVFERVASYQNLQWEITVPKDVKKIHSSNNTEGELYVLVIGESHSQDWSQFYNKGFDNTPNIQNYINNKEIFLLPNSYSSIPLTQTSVSLALSSYYAGAKKNNKWILLPSVAKKAGITTWWLSNQQRTSIWENKLLKIANECDHYYFETDDLYAEEKTDFSLLLQLQKTLSSLDKTKDNLIILHITGSHAEYADRYPNNYEHIYNYEDFYFGNLESNNIKKANEYMTSIRFNDDFMSEVIKLLKTQDNFMGLMYFSDHGEDMKHGHNAQINTFEMLKVPTYFYFSEKYKKEKQKLFFTFKNHQNEIFINDRVFDNFLSFMGISSSVIDKTKSLFSEEFKSYTSQEAITVNKKFLFTDPKLEIGNLKNKIDVIASANSIFKWNQIGSYSCDKFLLNISWNEKIKDFKIIKDQDQLLEYDNLSLKDFLNKVSYIYNILFLKVSNNLKKDQFRNFEEALDKNGLDKNLINVITSNVEFVKFLEQRGIKSTLEISSEKLLDQLKKDIKDKELEIDSFIVELNLFSQSDLSELLDKDLHFYLFKGLTDFNKDSVNDIISFTEKYPQVKGIIIDIPTDFD